MGTGILYVWCHVWFFHLNYFHENPSYQKQIGLDIFKYEETMLQKLTICSQCHGCDVSLSIITTDAISRPIEESDCVLSPCLLDDMQGYANLLQGWYDRRL